MTVAAQFKVAIDPGHGGKDPGAVGPRGLKEEYVVLAISRYLAEELQRTGQFAVMLTRTGNQYLDLRERGRKAAAWGAHLLISEHINSAGDSKATGTEVYYSVDLPATKGLAATLSAAVAGALGIRDRGAKTRESENYPGEDYYSVIDAAQDGGVPVVLLIESAFISNLAEEALLTQDSILRRIAMVQAEVICSYFGVIEGEAKQPVFKDMAGHWAEKDIEEAAQAGLVKGKGDGTFDPEGQVTRAESTVVDLRVYRSLLARITALEQRIVELEDKIG